MKIQEYSDRFLKLVKYGMKGFRNLKNSFRDYCV